MPPPAGCDQPHLSELEKIQDGIDTQQDDLAAKTQDATTKAASDKKAAAVAEDAVKQAKDYEAGFDELNKTRICVDGNCEETLAQAVTAIGDNKGKVKTILESTEAITACWAGKVSQLETDLNAAQVTADNAQVSADIAQKELDALKANAKGKLALVKKLGDGLNAATKQFKEDKLKANFYAAVAVIGDQLADHSDPSWVVPVAKMSTNLDTAAKKVATALGALQVAQAAVFAKKGQLDRARKRQARWLSRQAAWVTAAIAPYN